MRRAEPTHALSSLHRLHRLQALGWCNVRTSLSGVCDLTSRYSAHLLVKTDDVKVTGPTPSEHTMKGVDGSDVRDLSLTELASADAPR